MAATVFDVEKNSAAQLCGIKKGDILICVNNININDILDYRYAETDERLKIEVLKKTGKTEIIELEKDEYEPLGIIFENELITKAKSCQNKCIFCFIDQLPKGMRETLYFKDDDDRLSFLLGNYITLTSLSDDDINRIIKMRISLVNISVHTTNQKLRSFMMNNKQAERINEIMELFHENNIQMNCQIVLCKGINDGEQLKRTLFDLSKYYPSVSSVSVVPVGITAHREGLFPLEVIDGDYARKIIIEVEEIQKQFFEKFGVNLVYLADEFYILADEKIPDYESYDDFLQIENGVGMLACFQYEFLDALKCRGRTPGRSDIKKTIATGVITKEYIESLIKKFQDKNKNADIRVYDVKNEFFGENITVTGLLCGCDLINQLKGKDLGDELLVCANMFKSGEDIFLDDVTIDELSDKLGVEVIKVPNNGYDFLEQLLK